LVVDDEASYRDALTVGLGAEGFSVDAAVNVAEAFEYFEARQPDLILLDIMLPDGNGVDLCRDLRTRSGVPIIFVSAKSSEIDIVVGLEMGATDYIPKPYRLREVIARIRAVLRRSTEQSGQSEVITINGMVLDDSKRTCEVDGTPIDLTRKEFELLWLLLSKVGTVVTREECIDALWWEQNLNDSRTLDTHIKRLRQSLHTDPREPDHIVTVRGVGFRYDA
jgi:two-component system response regulator RegX3